MIVTAVLPKTWNDFLVHEARRTNTSKSAIMEKLIRKSIAVYTRQIEWFNSGNKAAYEICEKIKLTAIILEKNELGKWVVFCGRCADYEVLKLDLAKKTKLSKHNDVQKITIFINESLFAFLHTQKNDTGMPISSVITNAFQIALALDAYYDTLEIDGKEFEILEIIENTLVNFEIKNNKVIVQMSLVTRQKKKIQINNQNIPLVTTPEGKGSQTHTTKLLRRGFYDN